MVSFAPFASACALLIASTANADVLSDLPVGDFFRPEGEIVSAFPAANTTFRRSPCPVLNALSNHGYLPRDGKDVTKDVVRKAIVEQLNLDVAFANTLLGPLPETFNLNLLGTHGLIEHDASLVHADSYYGYDPVRIDDELVKDVLTRGDGKVYTVKDLGELRRDRLATCFALNPVCGFSSRDTTIAFGESGLIVDVLGGNKNSTITREHLESFLVKERIPADYVKSPTVVTVAQIQATAGKIVAIASAPRTTL